jgi:hypothetical protein
MTTAAIERAARSPNDLKSLYVQEAEGVSEFWQWHSWSCTESAVPAGFERLIGCEAEPYKAGKRKGKPNWKKKIPGTEKTVFIKTADFKAFLLRWEQETGKCVNCFGTGQEWAGSGVRGTRYRDCRKCGATGKPK